MVKAPDRPLYGLGVIAMPAWWLGNQDDAQSGELIGHGEGQLRIISR